MFISKKLTLTKNYGIAWLSGDSAASTSPARPNHFSETKAVAASGFLDANIAGTKET